MSMIERFNPNQIEQYDDNNNEVVSINNDDSLEATQSGEFLKQTIDHLKTLASQLGSYISKKFQNLNRLNIIITGKTGVGKSTLINNIFRDNLAKTGIGQPVTDEIKELTKKGVPLSIFDTPGLELNEKQQKNVLKGIFDLIEQRAATNDINKIIHCIWYCVNCESKRFEISEEEFIRQFTTDPRLGKVPVILVLTQSYDEEVREQMIREIEKKNLNVKQIVPVIAHEKTFKFHGNAFTIPKFGLDILIEVVENCLPEILIETLQNVQIASMSLKRKSAYKAIATSMVAAGTVAASPIPFSDCLVLVPIEAAMLTSITVIYGVEISSGFIADFLSCTIGCGTASLLGKMAVVNILKLIPGVGSVLGGFVSGSTASIITSALGRAYIPIIELIYNGEFDYKSITREQFKEKVQESFKNKIDEAAKQENNKKEEDIDN